MYSLRAFRLASKTLRFQTQSQIRVAFAYGDGIGSEIGKAVGNINDALGGPVVFDIQPVDYDVLRLDNNGHIVRGCTFTESFEKNKIGLKGPLVTPIGKGRRSVNIALRKTYDLYANVRPCVSYPRKNPIYENIDLFTIRENMEGEYCGVEKVIDDERILSCKRITTKLVMRFASFAVNFLKKNQLPKLICVHKCDTVRNADLAFLNTVRGCIPNSIHYEEWTLDKTCYMLARAPSELKGCVFVMPNLYGDICSDLAAGLIGGLGMTASANIGDEYALFEAVHGTAPDIAGKNVANPTALLLSYCMLLDYCDLKHVGDTVRNAIRNVMSNGAVVTRDLGGTAGTTDYTNAIIAEFADGSVPKK